MERHIEKQNHVRKKRKMRTQERKMRTQELHLSGRAYYLPYAIRYPFGLRGCEGVPGLRCYRNHLPDKEQENEALIVA